MVTPDAAALALEEFRVGRNPRTGDERHSLWSLSCTAPATFSTVFGNSVVP